jgi:hypothetical protein
MTTRNKRMKITKETLKKIIKEEIQSTLDEAGGYNPHNPMYQWAVEQGYADDPRPGSDAPPPTKWEGPRKTVVDDDPLPSSSAKEEPEAVNVLLNKLDHMGVEVPDVVGLKPEQLAGAIASALEKWKKG